MELTVNLFDKKSLIHIKRDSIYHLSEYLDLNRKVMIISDIGVPQIYKNIVLKQCPHGFIFNTPQGEEAKSFPVYEEIFQKLLELEFTSNDLIIALGGGVIGDLSGFVAATYHQGIHLSSIPTTTLSQIDSSIGGKVAINLNNVKNVVGTFYHPEHVIVDLNTLRTLPKRHYYNGLVEAVKHGLIYDKELFYLFEDNNANFIPNQIPTADMDDIITRSLLVKKQVVEQDEKEENLRKILNFGHTIGHAIESQYHLKDFYHGECVGMGMLAVLSNSELHDRLEKVLKKMNIPTSTYIDEESCINLIRKDKKANGDLITLITVHELGTAQLDNVPIEKLRQYIRIFNKE